MRAHVADGAGDAWNASEQRDTFSGHRIQNFKQCRLRGASVAAAAAQEVVVSHASDMVGLKRQRLQLHALADTAAVRKPARYITHTSNKKKHK